MSIRHTLVSAAAAAAVVLAAGSAMLAPTAPATSPAAPAPVEAKIATADTLLLLQALFDRPEMESSRQALAAELQASLAAAEAAISASEAQLQQNLQTLQARHNALPEGDPERANIVATYQAQQATHQTLIEQFQQQQQDADRRFDERRAEQLLECYSQLKAAIATVAQREGYTHVLSHATSDDQLPKLDFAGAVQGVRDRPVAFAPEGADLTDMLLAELGVERPTFEALDPTAPAGPDAPAGIDPTPVTPPSTDPAPPAPTNPTHPPHPTTPPSTPSTPPGR